MLKIILVVDGDEYGGAEIALIHLVRNCADGYTFELVGHECVGLRELSKRLPSIETTFINVKKRNSIAGFIAFYKIFKSKNADIIQITLCNPGVAFDAQLAGVIAGTPTIVVEQLVHNLKRRGHRYLKRFLSCFLSDHVAVGRRTAREVERHFSLPCNSVRTIYNGVHVSRKTTLRLVEGVSIGCVARLEAQKGIDRLISIMPSLPGVTLIIVGTGSLQPVLEKLAIDLEVSERVKFLGWKEDPSAYISGFHVFVLPSINEAFPLSIVEAMLLETPAVVSNVGSVSEAITHDETGLLVDAANPGNLLIEIKRVLNDVDLAERLTHAARERALDRFSAEATASDYRRMWSSPRGRLWPWKFSAVVRSQN